MTTITNAVYGDEDESFILAEIDGVLASIPIAEGNRHYQMIVAGVYDDEGNQIEPPIIPAPYVAPPVDPIVQSLDALRERNVTNNSVTAALFLNATKGDNTLLNYVETEIDSEAAVVGVSYAELVNGISGV